MKAPPRIFCPFALHTGAQVELPDVAAHHVWRVLRLAPDDAVTLFDGSGGEWRARITHADKRGVRATLVAHEGRDCESPLAITLLQGIASADKMDWIIQKAVELGVTRIVPLATERAVLKLSEERVEKRLKHWNNVIISACEQCGRNRLPELLPPMTLPLQLAQTGSASRIALSPHATQCLTALILPRGGVELLIGPEGGLSDREVRAACEAGFIVTSLGPRVLRTETAGIAAIAVLQARWGDWNGVSEIAQMAEKTDGSEA